MDNKRIFIEAKELSREIFDNARDIKLLIDPVNGRIFDANKAAIKTYGYSYEELLNMSIYQLRMNDNTTQIKNQMNSASDKGVLFETVHYCKDGSCIPVEVSSVNILEELSGRKILLSIIRDITLRKEREEKLRFSEDRISLIYETMDEGIALQEVILNENGKAIDYKFIDVNSSFAKVFGLTREEMIGRTMLQTNSNTDNIWIEKFGEVALSGKSVRFEYYVESLRKTLDVRAYSPKHKYFAVLFSDITELKNKELELSEKYEELTVLYEELAASEEELKANYKEMESLKEEADRANSAKSSFLANMSHEIRTPLNGVIGMAEILNMSELDDSQKEYCKIIYDSGEYLLEIINNILDISKIEAGKFSLDYEEFNIRELLDSIIKIYSVNCMKKGIELILYCEPSMKETLVGDKIRLNQILVNLLGNAFKFTDKGQIEIRVSQFEETEKQVRLQFSIKDTGIGIGIELKDKLFKIFTQGERMYTKKYGGTGLGLAICKELITMMDGDIWYVSQPNVGSTFYFNILLSKPRTEDNDLAYDMIERQQLDKQGLLNERKCVLVAEDNEINRKIVSAYLSKKNYKYICVSNGKQAVEEFKTNNVDLILMDIQMPEMNGIEATKRIREIEQSSKKRVNIIAMTAYAMKNDIDVCRNAGMDDFITKPIDLELFYNKVEKFM